VLVQTPVATYLRYYALFVLGDVSPDYDLLEVLWREREATGSVAANTSAGTVRTASRDREPRPGTSGTTSSGSGRPNAARRR
jgi:hypothetical protein